MSEKKCRVCGCTENNACVTAAGVCHWTEPESLTLGPLCSACAAKMPKLQLSEADVAILQQLPPIGVEIGSVTAFHILAALQLTCRRPETEGAFRASLEEVGRGLQEYLSVTENIAALCEAGWCGKPPTTAPPRLIILPGE